VFVHWQRTATSTGVVEKEPKGKSRRAIALGPAVVAELRAHKAAQDAEKARFGVVYRDGDYVFCSEDGQPYYPKYFNDQWSGACPSRTRGVWREPSMGRPFLYCGLRARVSSWPPLRLAWLRCERESVGVVRPAGSLMCAERGRRRYGSVHRDGRAPRLRSDRDGC
jgi:hypothetical protein